MLTRFRTRPRTRGQAIVETAIMMPLFLLGLFGVFWTVRQSALTERIQLGVRYGGTVTAMHDAFLSYSLYAVYSTLDGASPIDVNANCAPGSISSVTASRNAWWQPVGSVTTTCSGAITAIAVPSQNMLLENDFIGMAANAPVDAYLTKNVLGKTQTPVSAAENFFRSPNVAALVSCTTIGNAIKNSLEGSSDVITTILPPTPIPTQMTVNPIIGAVQACATFAPQLPSPLKTADPTPIPPTPTPPTPSPAPPTPTPIPTAVTTPKPPCTGGNTVNCTPTVAPTVAPTPTPTPVPPCLNGNILNCVPTAVPTLPPTPSPTPKPPCTNGNSVNCTPTASPSPVPTVTPSASPKPSPTPTPNPSGTIPPGAVG